MNKKQVCAIALGSNADPDIKVSVELVDLAISYLSRFPLKALKISNFYQTTSFPNTDDPDFVNAVVTAKTDANPEELLEILLKIEEKIGRKRFERWGARRIDLDLLYVGSKVHPDRETCMSWINLPLSRQKIEAPENLVLPHPRIQDRGFVLVPLCDVASDWVHPIFGKSAEALKSDLNPQLLDDVRLLRTT